MTEHTHPQETSKEGGENATPENLVCDSFVIRKSREEKTFVFPAGRLLFIICSHSCRERFLSLYGQTRYDYVCRQQISESLALNSATWAGCGSHAAIVLLFMRHAPCFCCLVLLLSKPAWFFVVEKPALSSNRELTRVCIFSTYNSLVGLIIVIIHWPFILSLLFFKLSFHIDLQVYPLFLKG